MNLADIPIGEDAPRSVHAVVEIPQKSKNKYVYDLSLELFRLKRVLHSAVQYPAAYGFIPQTLWDDNEPLDVMILSDEPLATGIIILVRPIGLLAMQDDEIVDSKVLAVPDKDPRYDGISDITAVSPHLLKEIEHFFETYKELEGKHVRSWGWSPVAFSWQAIERGMQEYRLHHSWRSDPEASPP
jgi:inorganic pyrophosphatase